MASRRQELVATNDQETWGPGWVKLDNEDGREQVTMVMIYDGDGGGEQRHQAAESTSGLLGRLRNEYQTRSTTCAPILGRQSKARTNGLDPMDADITP